MPLLVTNCPRCSSKNITFDVLAILPLGEPHYSWESYFEIYSACRHCRHGTIFLLKTLNIHVSDAFKNANAIMQFSGSLADYLKVVRFIGLRDNVTNLPPDHLPIEIDDVFREGAACFGIGCYNAAATMFRLCIDLATKPLLPDRSNTALLQPNEKIRRDLGLRLKWMFDNTILPSSMLELAKCIREDANDGAHAGNLIKEDAEDVLDFTFALLDRLISEPERLRLAEQRRIDRRSK